MVIGEMIILSKFRLIGHLRKKKLKPFLHIEFLCLEHENEN